MSVLRQAQPIRPIAPRRHLRPVTTTVQPVRRAATKKATRANAASFTFSKALALKVIAGLSLVSVAGLFVNSLADQAVYKISTLKMETAVLATQTQEVSQQVDSLRSPQNLANSAKALGMIVNSNPVFLNVKDAKVLGSAVPASVETSKAVSENLIANSAMTVKSNVSKLLSNKNTKIDAPTLKSSSAQSVTSTNSVPVKVPLNSVGIPASPTN
jgi:cell division protein FtsL